MTNTDFLADLRWRGLLHQATHDDSDDGDKGGDKGLTRHLASGQRTGYVGFDPTADSLTVGNLVPLLLLARLQRAGHRPIAIVGGGTGLIGDPSGKSAERQLLTADDVARNVAGQRRIYERVLDFAPGACAAGLLDNLDWLGRLSYIDVLRDVGKHFSINMMIQKESVRERLHNREQGISYTEFSYMLLQAYDYLHLHRAHGVTLQMGGSDQWGNIVAGCELIRRSLQDPERQVFGLTTPLITKADGGKFGKSEKGAVWLTADRTSPYAFYQFWMNTDDRDLERFLKTFTFFSQEEIAGLLAEHAGNPGARTPQRALARQVTELLHGTAERDQAEAAARALFSSSGELRELPLAVLEEVLAAAPATTASPERLAGEGLPLVDALVELTGLVKSKREAREHLEKGAVTLNGERVGVNDRLTPERLLHGSIAALRRGKSSWHVIRFR